MRILIKPSLTESKSSFLRVRFPTGPVKRLVDATLSKHLTKVKYDPEIIPELCKTISNDLLSQVKGKQIH